MSRRLTSTRVYDELRTEIIEGALAPGTRLAARALAQRFGVSDIPVREAIWMLARDGLVENTPYAGARVRQFTRREIEESLAIRGHLESLALRLGSGRLDADQVAEVERLLRLLDAALEAGDMVEYGRLNRLFHEAILVGCPNGLLLELIGQLWDGQASYQMMFRFDPDQAHVSRQEHRLIADAVIGGDGERAATLILQHRERGAKALTDTPLTQPD